MSHKLFLALILTYLSIVDAGYGPEMIATPQPDTYKKWLFWTVQPTLIHYNVHNYTFWTDKIDNFLEKYRKSGTRQTCDHSTNGTDKVPCDVDIGFGQCSRENNYGYNRGQPCIFLSLENRDDWKPTFYNNVNKLPKDMPVHLKQGINASTRSLDNIWVSCEGENSVDIENLGPISFSPFAYFPGYYFPYKNQKDYLSPLIAIQFERPIRGIIVNIRCKAWVGNIEYCTKNRLGTVNFELLIE